MIEFYAVLKQLWLLWFMFLFTGIVVWALWPSRKGALESLAMIPLRDDAPTGIQGKR
jgi:cytochrome c oxidase cbb3-type subunit 4